MTGCCGGVGRVVYGSSVGVRGRERGWWWELAGVGDGLPVVVGGWVG